MKQKFTEKIEIPTEVVCVYSDNILKCKKDSFEINRAFYSPNINLEINKNFIILSCEKGNKIEKKTIKSYLAHIKNMFNGLTKKHTYILEACNVHFPMNLKIEGNKLVINNFLGEKTPRYAEILPNVDVKIKGQEIIISALDKEEAGQTAANFEEATKIKNRDRRVFQDGIYLVKKPEDK